MDYNGHHGSVPLLKGGKCDVGCTRGGVRGKGFLGAGSRGKIRLEWWAIKAYCWFFYHCSRIYLDNYLYHFTIHLLISSFDYVLLFNTLHIWMYQYQAFSLSYFLLTRLPERDIQECCWDWITHCTYIYVIWCCPKLTMNKQTILNFVSTAGDMWIP